MPRYELDGKVAIVTGAGRGIGRAIALRLAADGLAVAVAARTLDQVEETATAIRKLPGGLALAVALDVTDPRSVTAAVERVLEGVTSLDVLVNNAGIAESAPFSRTDPALWERHFQVNVTGPYLMTRAVLPGMLERRWGRVINVASLAGLFGAPYVTAYTASKHALVGFTRALALEVSGKGVTVNALCPGYVATDMVYNGARNIAAKTGKSFEDAVQSLADINPGRRLIVPEDVAEAAARLVNDDMTNGEAVVLDGTAPAPSGRAR
jgi:NAD(P)-dependent dehydrogenase (short-subunit alcohol dehydrogenase family)